MSNFSTIEDVANEIKYELDSNSNKKNIVLLYAFNGTGKTRISTIINNEHEDKTLSYDVFFEDLFNWDNETYTLKINPYSKIITFIIEQGLEHQITDNFQKIIEYKIQPNYDFDNGQITFNFAPGDNRSEDNIKISRGEESIFIWTVYFTVLEELIQLLNESMENRATPDFNDLEYIIIDDPVSSIDESKIIGITVELIKVLNSSTNPKLKFLITTHHPLFFNILVNEYRDSKDYKKFIKLLSRTRFGLKLDDQKDTPFDYHLLVIKDIKEAIDSNTIQKYHFNLFRTLLEKTGTYLGYKNWYDCLKEDNCKEFSKLINLYSHGKLSDLESSLFPEEHKELFDEVFSNFIQDYKWKV